MGSTATSSMQITEHVKEVVIIHGALPELYLF